MPEGSWWSSPSDALRFCGNLKFGSKYTTDAAPCDRTGGAGAPRFWGRVFGLGVDAGPGDLVRHVAVRAAIKEVFSKPVVPSAVDSHTRGPAPLARLTP